MASAYFLDTSALLPRFLKRASGHKWVESICDPHRQNVIAIAEITATDIASALNQLVRGGTLHKKPCDESLSLFWSQVENNQYVLLPISSVIVRRAANLCSVRPLKGMDALQLACALMLRDDVRLARAMSADTGGVAFEDPIFLTEDHKLRDAAVAEGFVVDTPLSHITQS